jgi:hypothetical protein
MISGHQSGEDKGMVIFNVVFIDNAGLRLANGTQYCM